MNAKKLRQFATLTVRRGVNVKPGQDVIIHAELDQPEFVTMVVEEAYAAGAKSVRVKWTHQPISRVNAIAMKEDVMADIPEWQHAEMAHNVKTLPAQIHIRSVDPDGMKGVDQKKLSNVAKITTPQILKYREQMDNRFQWTIIGVPSIKWAEKVFPKLKGEKAVEAMWAAIIKATRVTNDPLKEWDRHNATLQQRSQQLDALNLDYLHFQSKNGTDFKIWMIPEARWLGGGEKLIDGHFYNPNMPTEEVFITPKAGLAEGKVVASKPLSYQGELIEDFAVTFAGGKVVKVEAKKNKALLQQLVNMDEGASRIGELALVPFDSPIQQSSLLFFNTLFDENAACHIALGRAYVNSIRGYAKMTPQQLTDIGCNRSMIHVDFMIGSRDLSITGYDRKGNAIAIFEKGNWAKTLK
ncbi:MAG: aminopeptidase [Bacilli bacterium]